MLLAICKTSLLAHYNVNSIIWTRNEEPLLLGKTREYPARHLSVDIDYWPVPLFLYVVMDPPTDVTLSYEISRTTKSSWSMVVNRSSRQRSLADRSIWAENYKFGSHRTNSKRLGSLALFLTGSENMVAVQSMIMA